MGLYPLGTLLEFTGVDIDGEDTLGPSEALYIMESSVEEGVSVIAVLRPPEVIVLACDHTEINLSKNQEPDNMAARLKIIEESILPALEQSKLEELH